MVIDVNAEATIDSTTEPDTITLQFGVAKLPGNESNMAGVYGIGNWYGYGYLYSDEDVAKAPASNTITGKLVKKWLDSSDTNSYVTAVTTNGVSTYAIKSKYAETILSAVDNGNGTSSITITSSFGAVSSYNGIASTYEEIIAALAAENPPRTGRTLELTGFTVTETGKMPKVYSLAENGLKLRSLGYEDNKAVLTYREFNVTAEDSYTFQLIVGAFNGNGNLLALKVDESKTITGADPDGEHVVTFAPSFANEILDDTAYYKVFAFETLVGGKPVMSSVTVEK